MTRAHESSLALELVGRPPNYGLFHLACQQRGVAT